MTMDAVLATIDSGRWALIQLNKMLKKYIDFYINWLILPIPFDSSLGTNMHKAARHSDNVVSLNPCCWRGERLHHHGGGVCWLLVLLWIHSWCHELIVCKKWYKNNPKEGLCGVTFCPTLACTAPFSLFSSAAIQRDMALVSISKALYCAIAVRQLQ